MGLIYTLEFKIIVVYLNIAVKREKMANKVQGLK